MTLLEELDVLAKYAEKSFNKVFVKVYKRDIANALLSKEDFINIYNELLRLQRYDITRLSRKKISKEDFDDRNENLKYLKKKIKKMI